eukprot:scaffold107306_cov66-Phaeocystis_antarctica.AAC.4
MSICVRCTKACVKMRALFSSVGPVAPRPGYTGLKWSAEASADSQPIEMSRASSFNWNSHS